MINIEKSTDWNRVINFYHSNNLFFQKKVLIINLILKQSNFLLVKNIKKIFFLKNLDILTIFQINQLSNHFKNYLLNEKNILKIDIIWCFTPYDVNFKYWLKCEIKEKKIKMTQNAFLLLYKYYEGNTLFVNHVLNMIILIWNNKNITSENIKKIIYKFAIFDPLDWINKIFQNNMKKALYILDAFQKQKYNPLVLIRLLQKDLLILLNMKRQKELHTNVFFKQKNVSLNRIKFFNYAIKSINFNNFLKVIRILLQMEIKIKIEYNSDVWIDLKTITLLLSSKI